MGNRIKTDSDFATSYTWPTTINVSPASAAKNYWLYHNGLIYTASPAKIPAMSGVPDDWSVAVVDANGNLWTTGKDDGDNGPNDNTALVVTITMNGNASTVTFQWTSGKNFNMPLYRWPNSII